jgi:hypothetical protein
MATQVETAGLAALMDPGVAKAALGISHTKLYEILNSGALPSVLIGKSRKITAQALADYINALPTTRPQDVIKSPLRCIAIV